MRRPSRVAVLVVIVAIAGAPATRAQNLAGSRAAVISPVVDDDTLTVERSIAASPLSAPVLPSVRRFRRFAALASFVVPGSGQVLLGNDRFVGYVAVEVLAWLQYSKDIADRAAQEHAYKDLARRVARKGFTTTFPDADWLYYEWMRDRFESGRFSLSQTGPIVPETDTSTFNGNRWVIAQATQPNDSLALEQYEREAIRPEYRWSWRNAQLHYDLYKRTTDKRNDAARAAVKDLLVIGANHFLSMVDAFATFRLQVQREQTGRTRVGASFWW